MSMSGASSGFAPPEALAFPTLLNVDDYRDSEGRALGEHRASKAVREATPMVLKQCPYPGSRFQHQHPMNVSALKQMTRDWDGIRGGIHLVRDLYLRHHGIDSVQQTKDCLAIGEAVACIPSYILHRAHEPVADGDVAPVVGGLFKVIIGINRVYSVTVSDDLMSDGRRKRRMPAPADVAAMVDFGGFLIGGEQVCAGSARQIAEAIDSLVNGGVTSPSCASVQRLLDPLDDFFAFAEGMRRVLASSFLCKAATSLALSPLAKALDQAPDTAPELRSTIADLLATADQAGTLQKFAATRTGAQLERLIQGWFDLAGGGPGQPVWATSEPEAREFATRLSGALGDRPGRKTMPDQVVRVLAANAFLLLNLERLLLPVVEQTETRLNAALGRSIPSPSQDPRRVFRGFGLPVLDRLADSLAVPIEPLASLGRPAIA